LNPENFILRCRNIKRLYDQNIYTFTEFSEEIDNLINELSNYEYHFNPEDFLLEISKLVNESILNSENLDRIKQIVKKNHSQNISVEGKSDKSNLTAKEEFKKKIKKEENNSVSNISKPDKTENVPEQNKNSTIKWSSILIIVIFLVIVLIVVLRENNNSEDESISSIIENSKTSSKDFKKEVTLSEPCSIVKDWIVSLGNSNFKRAYSFMIGKRWGTLSNFQSTKSYGGINKTKFLNCYDNYNSYSSSEVIAEYEAYDPYNNDGKYKQKFFLEKTNSNWYITKIENIEIINYRTK